MPNPFLKSAIVVFDQNTEGSAGPVREVLVRVSADGESVMFSLPNGEEWGCNQRELAELCDGKYVA